MNNLKRVLSLALASVMLIGMMAVGASATDVSEFSDGENITHVEAVDVMSTLGVIKGNTDGTYAPERIVKRGEMAAIITRVLNGGVEPTLGTSTSPLFTDVTTHWSRPYVEYCANLGIVNGMGDGTFHPEDPVTGAQAAKMLLVAAGYKSDIYGFTGSDWELNVNRIANQKGLYKELTLTTTSEGLSRDNAAQMSYNALDVHPIVVSYSQDRKTGDVTEVYGEDKDNASVLAKYFGTVTFIGTFDATAKTDAGVTDGEIKLVNGYREGTTDTAVNTANFPFDMDVKFLGEEVKVIYKENTKADTKPDKADTILGVFVTGTTSVVNTTVDKIAAVSGQATKVKLAGTTYTAAATNTGVVYNYDATTKAGATNAASLVTELTTNVKATNGDTVKAILNKNGEISSVYVVNYDLARVTSKNATQITLNNNKGTVTLKGNEIYEGIAKDDVVVVSRLYKAAADKGYTIITKAETVEGKVSGYKDTETVTVDGTAYKIYGKTALWNGTADANKINNFANANIGETAKLYLVNGYVRAASQTSESASNYSVVLEASTGTPTSVFTGLQLQVLDADGTKHIIKVSNNSSGKTATNNDGDAAANITQADYPAGTIVTYVENSDGTADVKIEALYGTSTGGTITIPTGNLAAGYVKATKTFNGTSVSNDCVLFVETSAAALANNTFSGATFKAYKIRELNDVAAAKGCFVLGADGKIVAAMMDLAADVSAATSTRVFGIVTEDKGAIKVGTTAYRQFIASVAGEEYTLNMKANTAGIDEGSLVSFEPSADNAYDDSEATTNWNTGKVHLIGLTDKNGTWDNAVTGWVEEYNEADGTLTVNSAITAKKADGTTTTKPSEVAYYVAGTPTTYVVDENTKLYYIDADNTATAAEGSISEYDTIKGYSNIIVFPENVSGVDYARVLLVETSGAANILAPAAATGATAVKVVAGTTKGLTADTGAGDDITSDPGTSGTPKTAAFSAFAADSKETFKFTWTADAAAEETVKLTVNGTTVTDYANGDDYKVTAAGTYKCVLTITSKVAGKTTKTQTFYVDVTVTAGA